METGKKLAFASLLAAALLIIVHTIDSARKMSVVIQQATSTPIAEAATTSHFKQKARAPKPTTTTIAKKNTEITTPKVVPQNEPSELQEAPGTVSGTAITIANVLNSMNAARYAQHVSLLQMDPQLSDAAVEKLNDMNTRGYFAHYAPDGTSPWTLMQTHGYSFKDAGENLAEEFTSIQGLMYQQCQQPISAALETPKICGWMNSPAHAENIMKPSYRDVGIAIGGGKVVVFFGSRNR